jgi:hypothetical protein
MIQTQINARIAAFAAELESLVRAAAVEAVAGALGGPSSAARSPARASAPATRTKARRRSRSRKPATASATATASAAPKSNGVPTDLDKAIVAQVKTKPGSRVEEIAKVLRIPSPRVKDRMSGLLESKTLKKTGATRGTKYFPF